VHHGAVNDVFLPLVLASRDLGRAWTEITGDLPAGRPVKSLLEDLVNPDALCCGTEFGCFVTLDRGQRWERLNDTSMPPAPVDSTESAGTCRPMPSSPRRRFRETLAKQQRRPSASPV
jgi:hypothetical protein